jgi:hypothetical protein
LRGDALLDPAHRQNLDLLLTVPAQAERRLHKVQSLLIR